MSAIRQVKTESGILQGVPGNIRKFSVFKGIPFAAPPVGELRFKAPQPVKPWDGVRMADSYSPIAPQTRNVDFYTKEFYNSEEAQSEDCLYLNVWTPAESADEKLPVMFWIHGGGFMCGYASEPEFDGEGYSKRGVILVTINYRLGVLGHLAHPELSAEGEAGTSGNYSLLDQIAALKWVKRNISAFGGDPDKITIFGQSAGAASVQGLCTSPLSKGLFARAILQSGGGVYPFGNAREFPDLKKAEKAGEDFLKAIGVKSIKELRELPAETIVQFAFKNEIRNGFIIDNYVIAEDPSAVMLKGENHDVDYMMGCTEDEGRLFGPEIKSIKDFRNFFRQSLDDKAVDEVLKIGNVKTDEDAQAFYKTAHRLISAVHCFAEVQQRNGKKAPYIYFFTRKLPGDDLGSFHSSELWFVFETIARCWRPFTGQDYDLALAVGDYFANFAKTGNPNGNGRPEWRPYVKEDPAFIELGLNISCKTDPETPLQKFQKEFFLK